MRPQGYQSALWPADAPSTLYIISPSAGFLLRNKGREDYLGLAGFEPFELWLKHLLTHVGDMFLNTWLILHGCFAL